MELTCPVLSTSQGQGTMDQEKDGMYTVSASTNSQAFKILLVCLPRTSNFAGGQVKLAETCLHCKMSFSTLRG